MTTPPPICAPKPTPLAGEEVVAGTDATVMNNARGYLAEFLVAKAIGSIGLRIE